jgi:hypothetical protein
MSSLLQRGDHTAEVNWTPCSDVSCSDTPKHATIPLKRVAALSAVVVWERVTAAVHLVERSIIVKRCVNPFLETGRVPTGSTCPCEKCLARIGMFFEVHSRTCSS